MKIKCTKKLLAHLLDYCIVTGTLPPVANPYLIIYKHLAVCPGCSDRLAAMLEENYQYELVLMLGEILQSILKGEKQCILQR